MLNLINIDRIEKRIDWQLNLPKKRTVNRSYWTPNPDKNGIPNPQRLALESEADILGYGGAAGGGKTDLLLGVAALEHQNSVIFRRVFPNLRGIIERSREIFASTDESRLEDSFNESLHRWRLATGQIIEFEACQHEKDKEKQRGRPRDFYGFDEATEFTKSQIDFITAWNRSTDPNQRCRVILTFNPPDNEAHWILDYFLPWLAYLFPDTFTHPNPAAPGELRYYDGEKEVEADTPRARSRTFIPAYLVDNPHLADTNYETIISNLPEPLRSQLLIGDFSASAEPNPWQVIPTEWIRLAQKRQKNEDTDYSVLSSVGIDAARGGKDKMVISKRYDNYFSELIRIPGSRVPDGQAAFNLTARALGDEEPGSINIDVIGIGSSPYDFLKEEYNTHAVNVASGSRFRDRTGKYKMRNLRAEVYWKLREALDPDHGDNLILPDDKELLADLAAVTYKITASGIQIESKDDIKERIGRSPDAGEALILSHYMPEHDGKTQDSDHNPFYD